MSELFVFPPPPPPPPPVPDGKGVIRLPGGTVPLVEACSDSRLTESVVEAEFVGEAVVTRCAVGVAEDSVKVVPSDKARSVVKEDDRLAWGTAESEDGVSTADIVFEADVAGRGLLEGVFDRIEPLLVSRRTGGGGTVVAIEGLMRVLSAGDCVEMLLL